ncbi:MAG: hypothetical protein IJ501_01810 [Bacilli bacterium]|nr:hypothetical protein [Bacilli bacterium]
MKKKKIFALIILIIGLILIVLALFINNNASTTVTDLEFKNLQITSDNSFTIDVYNPSNSKKESTKVILDLFNDKEKLIMNAIIEVPKLNSFETKTIEYSQVNIFNELPVDFKVKKYTENVVLKENISIEAKLGNILLEFAKQVVNENYNNDKNLDITLTALSLKNDFQKDLSELEKKEYKCSLENSFVEVKFINNNYNYTTYLYCEAFVEK